MLPRTVTIQKQRGQTPLDALAVLRRERPELADTPLAYAGRLDPMASGKLLVLVGDECKHQQKYHGLDKEYEAEVLLSVSTDTGDALGIPTLARELTKMPSHKDVARVLTSLIGSAELPYPAFSSKVVNGVPLFERSLDGSIADITIPTHVETIHRLTLLSIQSYTTDQLRNRIQDDLSVVPRSDDPRKVRGADFRQDAIRDAWQKLFKHSESRIWVVLTIRATVASGTYIRTLASRIGVQLETDGIAISIHRTRIGTYIQPLPFVRWRWWLHEY